MALLLSAGELRRQRLAVVLVSVMALYSLLASAIT